MEPLHLWLAQVLKDVLVMLTWDEAELGLVDAFVAACEQDDCGVRDEGGVGHGEEGSDQRALETRRQCQLSKTVV